MQTVQIFQVKVVVQLGVFQSKSISFPKDYHIACKARCNVINEISAAWIDMQ